MVKALSARRSAAKFLQGLVVLIGIGALALMLWEPHLEGRNAHATVFEIYFKDPFLAYAYTASIAFFMALFQAFTFLGYVRHNETFSPNAVKAIRTIKYCARALVALVGAAVAYICITVRANDDPAGGIAVGTFIMFVSTIVAIAAAVLERRLRS